MAREFPSSDDAEKSGSSLRKDSDAVSGLSRKRVVADEQCVCTQEEDTAARIALSVLRRLRKLH